MASTTISPSSPTHLLPPAEGSNDSTIDVIRREFGEMPGMRLTRAQFRRLWNLSLSECDRVVDMLIAEGFLVQTSGGHLRSTLDLCW